MSELVYLFVDGETTSTQEEILFNTLAGNPHLQQELQEAILIRSTLEQDCSALAVPPDTTAAIFQKAGFALPTAGGGMTAVTSWVGKTLYSLKSVALPALFTIGGATLATAYFMSHNPTANSIAATAISSSTYTPIVSTINTTDDTINNGALLNTSLFDEAQAVNIERSHGVPPTHQYRRRTFGVSDIPPSSASANSIPDAQMETAIDNGETSDIAVNNSDALTINSSPVKHSPFTHTKSAGFSSDARSIRDFNTTDVRADEAIQIPITASLRGLMNLSTFPSITDNQFSNEFNNIAVSVGYDVSNEIRIGVEGGRQSLRYYTFENGKNEKATLHTSMDWGGAFYRQTLTGLAFSEFTPYAQITLGGTVSGPSGRLLTGVSWQPDSRIALAAGLEGSAFLYQKSAEWYSLRSLGFMYQVEVKF